jgi:hypothetical protein
MWKLILLNLVLSATAFGFTLTDFAAFSREWQTCRSPGYVPTWDLDGSGAGGSILAENWLRE